MRIDVWSYVDEYAAEKADILDAVQKVFASGRLILGESVARFEEEFARYCDNRFGVGVDNGTNAIVLGLRALGVEAGDEVITVSNTAAPTIVAITALGAIPRFVDVNPEDFLMDVNQIERAITPKTRCIVPVHLFGQCVDMDAVNQIAARHGLKVLEDCAQSHGATYKGKKAGSMSDAAAFSFYPTKVLGCYGDGGMVVTRDENVARRARRLRFYGMEDRFYVVEPGAYNSRLDEVQAEILRRKLTRLESYIEARRAIAARYREAFAGTDLLCPMETAANRHVYYVYVVRHPKRDELLAELQRRDIHLNVSYRWPAHTMSGFTRICGNSVSLPHTEALANQIFSLPMYPAFSANQQSRTCQTLLELLRKV
ncbi:MAG TPA: DegT/DnrJ/EryC1/StrS family aminotransferase [Polyangiaceae bacterium]|nr:DegT/DnrJ/EryC1/StrS family aminotransferase [Polyangiaceae bacterium]